MSKEVRNKIDALLKDVPTGRRQALRRLLMGAGALALLPSSTLLALEPGQRQGKGGGRGGGKGGGKGGRGGKGNRPGGSGKGGFPGEGSGKGQGRGKGRRGGGGDAPDA